MTRPLPGLIAVLCAAGIALSARPQSPGFFPLEDVRPGMVGVGRTVFSGDTLEEFRANIVGVLRNVIGPNRNLVLAKLEGGPLASTGVIQGMSGSPVYIDGRLLGAVSYALGSFPKEPFAGITPIEEMTDAVNAPAPPNRRDGAPAGAWPTTIEGVVARVNDIATRALAPVGVRLPGLSVVGPSALADLAPALRPIGAAMAISGLDPSLAARLDRALPGSARPGQSADAVASRAAPLRPGEPVGMSLLRGDLELGATGTVTHVDGPRVYAFGHPFLNLGPTSMAMTRAHVYAVLPSLDTSMKIAGLGPVIGTMNQDRATAVGGMLGTTPAELQVTITLTSEREADRRFSIAVLHDEGLTALFSYVTIYNTLLGYERSAGALSIAARGVVDYGRHGRIEIDDFFAGPTAIAEASAGTTASIGPAATNGFESVMPSALDLTLHVTERVEQLVIERAWLDTTRPQFGGTHRLHVLLREHRGGSRTIDLPVTMPAHGNGPLTLAVLDAATLTQLEQRDVRPAQPASIDALFLRLAERRQGNRVYVRLIDTSAGTAVAGLTLPALPGSVRSVLDADSTVKSATVSKTVVGAWEQRFDAAVRGSHELTIQLTAGR
jgi:hypothetical protein